MIELPEAFTLAGQMNAALRGRRIRRVVRGNAPHKFAFYNHTPEEYSDLLEGCTLGDSCAQAGMILTDVEHQRQLVLGGGGERILLHEEPQTLPKKHQFLLEFEDGSLLSVTIQMWGTIAVLAQGETLPYDWRPNQPTPLDNTFTYDYFTNLFDALAPDDPRSLKYFLISKPGIPGIGNGYTQDILFRARLLPRHRASLLTPDQRNNLFHAIGETIRLAVQLGGRASELDLFGNPGGYMPILDSKTAKRPCPICGEPIHKESYLGGSSYFCPTCQE